MPLVVVLMISRPADVFAILERRVAEIESLDAFAVPLAAEQGAGDFLLERVRLLDGAHRPDAGGAVGERGDHRRGRAQHVEYDRDGVRKIALRQQIDLRR